MERVSGVLSRLMSHLGLGGSVVPSAVTERVDRLGLSVVRMYGSTEHPSTTGAPHDAPREKRLHTDGRQGEASLRSAPTKAS